jgi:tetratricopeptide (TPR) repeat protein
MNNNPIIDRVNQFIKEIKVDDALAELSKAIENDPDNIELLTFRADIFYKLQNFPQSIDDLNRILSIEPNNEIATQKLSLINDIIFMIKTDIFESTNLYEPEGSIFSDGDIRFR